MGSRVTTHLMIPSMIPQMTWFDLPNLWIYVLGACLIVGNLGCVAMIVCQLPGTWLMLVLTAGAAWWGWETQWIGPMVLLSLLLLAILGEIAEIAPSVRASRKIGGSKRSVALILIGSVTGAILGTPWVPVLGTILGACLGAGVGALLGDRWAGRSWRNAISASKAAAKGRFWGTLAKSIIGMVMWLIATLAVLVG